MSDNEEYEIGEGPLNESDSGSESEIEEANSKKSNPKKVKELVNEIEMKERMQKFIKANAIQDPESDTEPDPEPPIKKPSKKTKKLKSSLKEEDLKEQELIIKKINRYMTHTRFASYLSESGFTFDSAKLKAMALDELEEYYKRVESVVDQKANGETFNEFIFAGLYTVEKCSQINAIKRLCDLNGLVAIMRRDPTTLDALAQLEINYGDFSSLSPEKRLLLCLTRSAFQVALINKHVQNLPDGIQPVARETAINQPTTVNEKRPDNIETDNAANNLATELKSNSLQKQRPLAKGL